MKQLSELRRTIQVLGINENGTYRLRFWAFRFLVPLLTFSSIAYVFYNWGDMGKRMEGIRGVVLYFLVQSYVLVVTCNWNNIRKLLEILEARFYEFPFSATNGRLSLERRIKGTTNQTITIWRYLLDSVLLLTILPSITVFIFHIMTDGIGHVKINKLYLPFAFHFPRRFETLSMYILGFTLQSFFIFKGIQISFLVVVISFVSIQRIVGDLKLLRLGAQELNNILLCNVHDLNHRVLNNVEDIMKQNSKRFLICFVKEQQHIYRKTDDVSRRIQHVTFIVDTAMSAILCTSIYRVAQSEEFMVKIQEAVFSTALIYCLYCYHALGEEVTTEDENIRQALYQISWIDKPKEFRKSIHIITTRMTRKLEIKRHGIFTLNLQHFVTTVRAAYSFYNILNKLTN